MYNEHTKVQNPRPHSLIVISKEAAASLFTQVLFLSEKNGLLSKGLNCVHVENNLRNFLITLAMNIVWLRFFHHSATLHEAILLVFVPLRHDTHFLSYENCHNFPIVIYSMLEGRRAYRIDMGCLVHKFVGPSLVPRPLPAFQCCTLKSERAWYAMAREWRFTWNRPGIDFIVRGHILRFVAYMYLSPFCCFSEFFVSRLK